MIGPELSYAALARARLRELLFDSGLSIRELASALGVVSSTIERHIGRGPLSRSRRSWYHRIESVTVDDERIHIIVRHCAPTRKPWGWDRRRRPTHAFDLVDVVDVEACLFSSRRRRMPFHDREKACLPLQLEFFV